jgi:hypothetical protein
VRLRRRRSVHVLVAHVAQRHGLNWFVDTRSTFFDRRLMVFDVASAPPRQHSHGSRPGAVARLHRRSRAVLRNTVLRNTVLRNTVLRNTVSPTFPTGALILEFCRRKLNLFKGRRGGNACSEDLPSFRLLACA